MKQITNTTFLSPKLAQRADLDVRAGDTVRVHVKIEEKGKTRIQMFEGLVLARKHGTEAGGTITVRKISHGVGVERIFPVFSPVIDKIEVVRRARTRRSKLYFIREKVARDIRRKMRSFVDFMAAPLQGFSDKDIVEEEIEEEVIDETPVVEEVVETAPEVIEEAAPEAEEEKAAE
jgi:large subunit ribosomal protein L19